MSRADEIDIAKGVACPGYKKLLVLEDCKACTHFVEIKREEVKQTGEDDIERVVDVIETILCSYPSWREVHTLCKSGKGGS